MNRGALLFLEFPYPLGWDEECKFSLQFLCMAPLHVLHMRITRFTRLTLLNRIYRTGKPEIMGPYLCSPFLG